MLNVLWLSRHTMTGEQLKDLNNVCQERVNIIQVNKSFRNADEIIGVIKEEEKTHGRVDILAVVLPIELVAELLSKVSIPVIFAKNDRILVKNPDGGEDKVQFRHAGWFQYKKIEIEVERL